MERVTGLGGIFFKANDPEKLYAWYDKHLGIKAKPGEGGMFKWRDVDDPQKVGMTVWSIFKQTTKYFEPSKAGFMLNYRVKNLDEVLAALRAEGVWIDEKREDHDYGRFAWIMDPEGNRIELWEPPANG
jgi:predicted enzyme related to lactoylglutathione lyase